MPHYVTFHLGLHYLSKYLFTKGLINPLSCQTLIYCVLTALCAASQLPGEGPTDVEDAPAPAH